MSSHKCIMSGRHNIFGEQRICDKHMFIVASLLLKLDLKACDICLLGEKVLNSIVLSIVDNRIQLHCAEEEARAPEHTLLGAP